MSEDRLARIVYTEIDARGAGAYMANFVGGEHRGAGKIGGSEIDVHHRLKKQPDLRALALFVRAPSSKIDLEETLQNFFALPHAKVKGTDRFAWPFTQQDVLAACEYLTNQGVRFCCASIPEHLRASGSALWALEAA